MYKYIYLNDETITAVQRKKTLTFFYEKNLQYSTKIQRIKTLKKSGILISVNRIKTLTLENDNE